MRTKGWTGRAFVVAVATLLVACGSESGEGSRDDAVSGGDGTVSGSDGTVSGGDGTAGVDVEGVEVVELAALAIGDCVSPPDDNNFLAGAAVQSCDEPHAMQFLGRYTLPDAAAYPGSRVLGKQAYFDCIPMFEAYVGISFWQSAYDLNTVIPSVFSWEQGDREVLCVLVSLGGEPLTRSLQGAAR